MLENRSLKIKKTVLNVAFWNVKLYLCQVKSQFNIM